MDKHINILKQLYQYHWDNETKIHNMLKTFDILYEMNRQFLYETRIYDLLKD